MAGLRTRHVGCGHLSPQSSWTHGGRRVDRGHHVQGVSLRHGIARGSRTGGLVRRSRDIARAGRISAAEVRAASAEGRIMSRPCPRGRKPALYVLAGIAIVAASAAAQQTLPETPFRYERPVQTGGSGPRRLAIDVPLLVGGSSFRGRVMPGAGLTDLRFFDPNGQELQYLLVANPPEQPVWRSVRTLAIAAVETPTLKTSGFEIDLGQPLVTDRFRIDGVAGPFLKRIRLEGSGDRARWTLLVDEGTMFDLPQERLVQTEVGFAPGAYRYIRLTWDDTRSGRLVKPELASVREVRNVIPPPPLTTPLTFERRPSEPGRGQFRVRLPAARLPIVALDVDIAGTRVLRQATVF